MPRVVITGGASGVGAALAARVANAGAEVWVLDVQAPASALPGVTAVHTDLTDATSIAAALNALPERIDGLANVAGMARAPTPAPVIAVNFLALRHLTEALTPRMAAGGSIANVSSIAGRDWARRVDKLEPLLASGSFEVGLSWCAANEASIARDPYTLSKRLVTAYTLRRAATFVRTGVRVNCVSPGPISTPLYPQFEALMGKDQSDWTIEQIGAAATADDIAQVLEYLLIGDSRWLNGVDIPVDGGYSAGLSAGWIDFEASPVMKKIRARRGE